MKKAFAVLIIIMSLTLSACKSTDTGLGKAQTPQEFAELMYKGIDSGKITLQNLYDNEFVSNSKSAISAEDFIAEKTIENEDILKEDVTISKISSVVEKEYENDISKINTTLEYTINGQPVTKNYVDYISKIFGKYKYLYRGITAQMEYNMASTDASYEIHSDTAMIYDTVYGLIIELGMTNDTAKTFSFGSESGAGFEITTTEGNYSIILPQVYILNTDSRVVLIADFPDAKGTVTNIRIQNIYTLNEQNLPVETGSGKTYALKVV